MDTLIYRIEAFDKKTEFLTYKIDLPGGCDSKLAQIMGWSSPQRGDEGYNMSPEQAAAIEQMVGTPFYDNEHIFQLTCNAG